MKRLPLYESGDFWVVKAAKGYEVYQTGATASTRVAIIGSEGEKWFQRAKDEADRRHSAVVEAKRQHETAEAVRRYDNEAKRGINPWPKMGEDL